MNVIISIINTLFQLEMRMYDIIIFSLFSLSKKNVSKKCFYKKCNQIISLQSEFLFQIIFVQHDHCQYFLYKMLLLKEVQQQGIE